MPIVIDTVDGYIQTYNLCPDPRDYLNAYRDRDVLVFSKEGDYTILRIDPLSDIIATWNSTLRKIYDDIVVAECQATDHVFNDKADEVFGLDVKMKRLHGSMNILPVCERARALQTEHRDRTLDIIHGIDEINRTFEAMHERLKEYLQQLLGAVKDLYQGLESRELQVDAIFHTASQKESLTIFVNQIEKDEAEWKDRLSSIEKKIREIEEASDIF
jgi:hypothetical protein